MSDTGDGSYQGNFSHTKIEYNFKFYHHFVNLMGIPPVSIRHSSFERLGQC